MEPPPMLETRQLNNLDKEILDELHRGRATPGYLEDRTGYDQSYISQRLRRLEEHDHVQRIARGLWELVDDPREDVDPALDADALRDRVEELEEKLAQLRAERDALQE